MFPEQQPFGVTKIVHHQFVFRSFKNGLAFRNPFEEDPKKAPNEKSPLQVLMDFFKPRNLTSLERDIGLMLDAGMDPWDPRIFLRLRKTDPEFEPIRKQGEDSEPIREEDFKSEPRPALEVVHLWQKLISAKFPQCLTKSACAISSNLIR